MIALIVALGKNNLIGKGNDLPWHYSEDLKYFKETTLHKTVLMGEATFYSIVNRLNKPLPNRNTIVATLDLTFHYEGVRVIHDLFAFLKNPPEEDIFIIGGKQIYQLSLPYVNRMYITHVHGEHDGDVFLNGIDYNQFECISCRDQGDLSFCIYERRNKPC
ncbi:MAG: dihydrofolate reductase [Bacilli bacterium]